jgi:sugar phosphate isomerase/epimerase
MPSRLHVRIPYEQLASRLPDLLNRRLQPEVALRGEDLDRLDSQLLETSAAALARNGLTATVHAPFLDLNPGALEPLVFEATALRYRQALAAAALLKAKVVVLHPGYEYWKYGGRDELWLEASLTFWPPLLELADQYGLQLVLENVFETKPEPLVTLLNRLDSPTLGHCFDVGHWHLFSKVSLDDWFTALGPHLCHLHLHDNTGNGDDHLPVGEGDIDFDRLFHHIDTLPNAPSMTLEVTGEDALLRALSNVADYLA